jgi:hypothetical protein
VQLLQNSKLERRVKELSNEIDGLKEKLTLSRKGLADESEKERNEKRKNENLVLELREMLSKNEMSTIQRCSKLEMIIEEKEVETKGLYERIVILESIIDSTAKSSKDMLDYVKKENSEVVSKLKESISYMKDENEALKKEISNQISSQAKQSNLKIKENEERILKITSENERLNKENTYLKKSLLENKLVYQIDLADKEKKGLEVGKSLYEDEIRELNRKIYNLNMKIDDLQKKLEGKSKENSDLTDKHVKEMILLQEKDLKELSYEKINLSKSLNEAIERKVGLELSLKEKEVVICQLRKELNEKSRAVNDERLVVERRENEMKEKYDKDLKCMNEKKEYLEMKVDEGNSLIEKLKLKILRLEQGDVRLLEGIRKRVNEIFVN